MPTLTEIVNDNPTIEDEDLRLLFTRRLDVQSQVFFLQVGFILGILGPITISALGLGVQPFTVIVGTSLALLATLEVGLVWELRTSFQKRTPSIRHETVLKDYLEARKIIRDRAKP